MSNDQTHMSNDQTHKNLAAFVVCLSDHFETLYIKGLNLVKPFP